VCPGRKNLYHEPCHTPMKAHRARRVLTNLPPGQRLPIPDGRCGEADTPAVTRPDISAMIRLRKEEVVVERAIGRRRDGEPGDTTILTSCPACLQGLSRRDARDGKADYIVCELAKRTLGENWQGELIHAATHGGVERVLF